jgi:predicted O-linked N-acetylglucosamine transferase (SPINDLY family)
MGLLDQAITLHQRGNLSEAEIIYKRVLSADLRNFEALHMLGIIHAQRNEFKAAEKLLCKALSINRNAYQCHHDYGHVLFRLGRSEEAVASYDKALSLNPSSPTAYYMKGLALSDLGNYVESLECYERATVLAPTYAEAWCNRGNVLYKLNRHDEALAAYNKSLRLRPDLVEGWTSLGSLLGVLTRFDEALAVFEKALALKPHFAEAWGRRGDVYTELKRYEEAFASYDRAFTIMPTMKYVEGGRLHAKAMMCDWSDWKAEVSRFLSAMRKGIPSLPFQTLSIPSSPADQLECAKRFVADQGLMAHPASRKRPSYSLDRIHIAYLSADFNRSPVAHLITELFELHDRSRFEVIGISFGRDDKSDMRSRLIKSFDRFHDVKVKADGEVARLLAELQVDIAVDLMGHTQGSRPNIFAQHPAPIQVSYLGYPGTMGTSFIDYIIADKIAVPFEQQRFYSEKIVHLPDCYQVNDSQRKVAARTPTRQENGLPEDAFVFCCFNGTYKITPPVFDMWMRLLRAVKGSVLWVSGDNRSAQTNLRREAAARGIDPVRLIFIDRLPQMEDHLARHRLADLFLDTLPYNAHTTASDALRTGLPVVTCCGETFAGRVATSLLCAVGLSELVTHNLEEYEALVLKLVTDASLLQSVRRKLEQNRRSYPLFDTRQFTRHIEAAYVTMWERHQRGGVPTNFTVDRLDGVSSS